MVKKLTQFGVAVRKKRLERQETLSEMAAALEVSPSFISGIEVGDKRAPADLVERIINYLEFDMAEAEQLRLLAEETGPEIRLPLAGKDNRAREVAALFRRHFEAGEYDQLKEALQEIAKKKGHDDGKGH